MHFTWTALVGASFILSSSAGPLARFEQSRATANITTLAPYSAALSNITAVSEVSSAALFTPAPSPADDTEPSWRTPTGVANVTNSPHPSSLMNFDIKRYAAIGDSYAAGVGSGKRINHHCSRSDQSYPYLLNVDLRGGKNNVKGMETTFDFTACTGANVDYVVKRQLRKLTGKYDLITLTIGGNDIDFVNLVNDCIFGWIPKPIRKCYTSMEKSALKMGKVTQDLGDLLATLTSKHLAKGGHIYVTGYGKLFNDETEQCDNVNLALFGLKKPLLRERREKFNRLGDMLNGAIKSAVLRAGTEVTFVHYDPYMGMCKGRMCEADATEPDLQRNATMIFEHGGPSVASPPSSRLNTAEGIVVRDGISSLIPDKMLRTAHPRPNGHRMIADLILYHMDVQKSVELGLPAPAEPGIEICGARYAIEEGK